jgi:hypothetical protein
MSDALLLALIPVAAAAAYGLGLVIVACLVRAERWVVKVKREAPP